MRDPACIKGSSDCKCCHEEPLIRYLYLCCSRYQTHGTHDTPPSHAVPKHLHMLGCALCIRPSCRICQQNADGHKHLHDSCSQTWLVLACTRQLQCVIDACRAHWARSDVTDKHDERNRRAAQTVTQQVPQPQWHKACMVRRHLCLHSAASRDAQPDPHLIQGAQLPTNQFRGGFGDESWHIQRCRACS